MPDIAPQQQGTAPLEGSAPSESPPPSDGVTMDVSKLIASRLAGDDAAAARLTSKAWDAAVRLTRRELVMTPPLAAPGAPLWRLFPDPTAVTLTAEVPAANAVAALWGAALGRVSEIEIQINLGAAAAGLAAACPRLESVRFAPPPGCRGRGAPAAPGGGAWPPCDDLSAFIRGAAAAPLLRLSEIDAPGHALPAGAAAALCRAAPSLRSLSLARLAPGAAGAAAAGGVAGLTSLCLGTASFDFSLEYGPPPSEVAGFVSRPPPDDLLGFIKSQITLSRLEIPYTLREDDLAPLPNLGHLRLLELAPGSSHPPLANFPRLSRLLVYHPLTRPQLASLAARAPALKALHFLWEGYPASDVLLHPFPPMPALTHLHVHDPPDEGLAGTGLEAACPNLESLVLYTAPCPPEDLQLAKLPALRVLSLYCRDTCGVEAAPWDVFVAKESFPAVEALGRLRWLRFSARVQDAWPRAGPPGAGLNLGALTSVTRLSIQTIVGEAGDPWGDEGPEIVDWDFGRAAGAIAEMPVLRSLTLAVESGVYDSNTHLAAWFSREEGKGPLAHLGLLTGLVSLAWVHPPLREDAGGGAGPLVTIASRCPALRLLRAAWAGAAAGVAAAPAGDAAAAGAAAAGGAGGAFWESARRARREVRRARRAGGGGGGGGVPIGLELVGGSAGGEGAARGAGLILAEIGELHRMA